MRSPWDRSVFFSRGGLLSRAVAVALTAALLLTAPGLPFYRAFAADTADTGDVAPVPNGNNGGAGAITGPKLGDPALPAGNAPINVALPGAALDLPAARQPAAPAPVTIPGLGSSGEGVPSAAPAPSAAASASESAPAALRSQAAATPAGQTLKTLGSQESSPEFYRLAVGADGQQTERAQALLAPSAQTLNDAQAAKSWGWDSFSRMFGLGGSGASRAVVSAPAAAPVYGGAAAAAAVAAKALPAARPEGALFVPAPNFVVEPPVAPRSTLSKRLLIAGGAGAVIAGGVLLALSGAAPAAVLAAAPIVHVAAAALPLHTIGQVGYWTGNVLGFVFPFGSIYSLLRTQKAENMSTFGPAAAFGASMLNSVVAMSVASPLWGIQNVFSGFGLLGIVMLARHYGKKPGQEEAPLPGVADLSVRRVAQSPAARNTAAFGAALAVASVGLYWLGSVTLPGVMPALNAAASWISLGHVGTFSRMAQLISSAVFLGLMLPDAYKLARTKDAGSNSSAYYLTYLVASLGLGLWAGASWLEASDAAQKTTHLTNLAMYAVSALPALAAYWLTRKFSKTPAAKTAFEQGQSVRDEARPLPSAIKIEAAVSPGVGVMVEKYLDKMTKLRVLAFDLNDPVFSRKLVAMHKAAIPVEVLADRRQAFTPHSLVGWLRGEGVPVLTVSGLMTNGKAAQDNEETQAFVETLQSQIANAALKPEAKAQLLEALNTTMESNLDAAFPEAALADGQTAGRRGIQHMKVLLGEDKAGNKYLILGSANWTTAALGDAGMAANHDGLIFLTYPKGNPADAYSVFEQKLEAVKVQAQKSKQDPAPPVHTPPAVSLETPAQAPLSQGGDALRTLAFGKSPGSRNVVPEAPERGLSPSKGDLAAAPKSGFFSNVLGFFHKPRAPERPAAAAESASAPAEAAVNSPENAFAAQVSEDAFGVRHISGLVHAPQQKGLLAAFRRLWSRANIQDAAAAQDLIARTYGISHGEIAALASKYGLPLEDRAAWTRLYDQLGKFNRRAHDLLDGRKENIGQRNEFTGVYKYAVQAWRAARPGEKNLIQSTGLFAYGLFDMFVLGYFRRAISYQLFHADEDFISIGQAGAPERMLERMIRAQAPLGTTAGDRFSARLSVRLFNQALYQPLLSPLFQFATRRATLAVLSLLAGGIISAFSVFPFMTWSLAAHVSWLLPGVHAASLYVPFVAKAAGAVNGLVTLVHFVRNVRDRDGQGAAASALSLLISAFLVFSGAALGPVFEKAVDALLKDLVLGPLLQTFTLSWMLVAPKAVMQRLADERRALGLDFDQKLGFSRAAGAVLRMLFVPLVYSTKDAEGRPLAFYSRISLTPYARQLLTTFGGMVTVGAEIAGVMSYLGAWDSFFAPAYHGVTGHDFHLFETLGAAVERPALWTDYKGGAHKNIIPFGGAITWGGVLLARAETWTGFDPSVLSADWTLRLINAVHPTEKGSQILSLSGAARTEAIRGLRPAPEPLSPELQKLIDAQVKKAVDSGDVKKEIERTQQRIDTLQSQLGRNGDALGKLKAGEKPLPAKAREEQARVGKELSLQKTRLQILDKLAQKGDLMGKGKDAKGLADLTALDDKLSALLPAENHEGGYREALQSRAASLASLEHTVAGMDPKSWNKPAAAPEKGAAQAIDGLDFKKISTLLDGGVDPVTHEPVPGLFTLQNKIRSEITARDGQAKELSGLNTARMKALNAYRNGDDFMAFMKKQSQLSMVTYIKGQIAEANAAEAAISQMETMLNNNISNFNAQTNTNNANNTVAQNNLNQIPNWNSQVAAQVQSDNSYVATFQNLSWEASNIAALIPNFQNTYNGLLTLINQRDRDQDANGNYLAANAQAEYARILGMLPQVQALRQNGNPSNPNYLSVAFVNNYISEISGYLTQAQAGVSQIQSAPQELAGLLLILVPGTPTFSGSNPSNSDVINYIGQRQTYWQGQQASYQSLLNSITAQLDPNNTTMVTNDFGVAQPQSAVRYLAQEQTVLSQDTQLVNSLTAAIDLKAADITAKTGVALPRLSGLGYAALGSALLNYQTALNAIPSGTTTAAYQAQFDELSIATMLGPLADATIQWAYAQNVVSSLQQGVNQILPQAAQAIGQAVALTQAIIADGQQDLTFINTPLPTDPTTLQNVRQALINRKLALVQSTLIPDLTAIQTFMTQTLLPYEQAGVAQASPVSNGSNFAYFYQEKQTVYNTIQNTLNQTVPLIIAQSGAGLGATLSPYQTTISQEQTLINEYTNNNPNDPNYLGLKTTLYGISMPMSLYGRIQVLTADENTRLAKLQTQAAAIDAITTQINALTNNQYHLQPLAPQASNPNNLVNTIVPFGQTLQQIANAAKAGGTTATLSSSGQLQANTNTKVADMCLSALNLLLPSPINPSGNSMAENTAGWVLDNGVITASQTALAPGGQIPTAQAFLSQANTVIAATKADSTLDAAYVSQYSSTPPTVASGAGQALLTREAGIYNNLANFTNSGVTFFQGQATNDAGGYNTINQLTQFWQAQQNIASYGNQLATGNVQEQQAILAALQAEYASIDSQKQEALGWLAQLNPMGDPATQQVIQAMQQMQGDLVKVLEQKVKYDKSDEKLKWDDRELQATLGEYRDQQRALADALRALPPGTTLDPATLAKVQSAMGSSGGWMLDPGVSDGTQAIVVNKSDWPAFAQKLVSALKPDVDAGATLESIEKNPASIAELLPGTKMLNMGDDANGFYLVYSSYFGTPGGIETSSMVKLGNVATLWGQNLSVTGYHFASPPNAVNAPYGDQGLALDIESLQGHNWVNYLDVVLHKNLQDLPAGTSPGDQIAVTRLMVLENGAWLLDADNNLYFSATGYGDWALENAAQNPYYYGSTEKVSMNFTPVTKLSVEQSDLFAKDPTQFLETINLNGISGTNPTLNQNFTIQSQGVDSEYHRTQVGPTFDVGKMMKSPDAFTVEVYVANQWGTDNVTQQSLGTTVVKGFSFPLFGQKATLTNTAGEEAGTAYNSLTDKIDLMLPDSKIDVSAQGQLTAGQTAFYTSVTRHSADGHSALSLGYGAPYLGEDNRLRITTSSQYTLAEIFNTAVDATRDQAKGGAVLKDYRDVYDAASGADAPAMKELKDVFASDAAKMLDTQQIGKLYADVVQLQKAGAILDNTHVQATLGFVSGPPATDTTDLGVAGGYQVGVVTDYNMSKTQKELMEKDVSELYLTTVQLRDQLVDLTAQWRELILLYYKAETKVRMAQYLVKNSSDPLIKQEAQVRIARAQDEEAQASLRYNELTGRDPNTPFPFKGLREKQVAELLADVQKLAVAPDALGKVFAKLDPGSLPMPQQGFNLIDHIPWIEQLDLVWGTQMQDMLAGQALGFGVAATLPIYDSSGKTKEAYKMQSQAAMEAMAEAYKQEDLKIHQQTAESQAQADKAETLEAGQAQAGKDLALALAGQRNGTVPASALWQAADSWEWYTDSLIEARARASVANNNALLGRSAQAKDYTTGAARLASIDSLEDAYRQATVTGNESDALHKAKDALQKGLDSSDDGDRIDAAKKAAAALSDSGKFPDQAAQLSAVNGSRIAAVRRAIDAVNDELAILQRQLSPADSAEIARHVQPITAELDVALRAALKKQKDYEDKNHALAVFDAERQSEWDKDLVAPARKAADALAAYGDFAASTELLKAASAADEKGRAAVLDKILDWDNGQLTRYYEPNVPAHDLAELYKRAEGAKHESEAAASRISKVDAKFSLGTNVTTSGTALLPIFGITGVSLLPSFDFQFTSAELSTLDKARAEGHQEYYDKMLSIVEFKIAVELYHNYLVLWTSGKQAEIYRGEIIPRLERDALSGTAASREALDHGRLQLQALEESQRGARRLINSLLNQPLDTPLTAALDPQKAQDWMESLIVRAKPAVDEQRLRETEVDVAQNVETVVDKNLKPSDLQAGLSPTVAISLVVRSVSGLVHALMDEPTATKDLVEAARQQTLAAQAAVKSYHESLPVERARAQADLSRVKAELAEARAKGDPESRVQALNLEQRQRMLTASIDALSAGNLAAPYAPGGAGALPKSFSELETRLEHAQEGLAQPAGAALPQDMPLAPLHEAVQAQSREFYANTDLGGNPINQWYHESWVTAELNDTGIDKGKLRELGDIIHEKSDDDFKTAVAKSHAEAAALTAEFEMLTQLYRAANKPGSAAARGVSAQDLDKYRDSLQKRLEDLRLEIAARLGLDPKTAALDSLMALVPEGSQNSDPAAFAQDFLRQMQLYRVDAVGQILFDGILPKAAELDIRQSKIQADMTAQQMSYKGFKPVLADGVFRGQNIWMGAIQAPNPQEIQDKLTDVLSDALRRDINSKQKLKDLAAGLYARMRAVDDGTQVVQKYSDLVRAAQDAVAAETAKQKEGAASALELFNAEERLVQAQKELTDAMVRLHTDFVNLVTELSALGLKEKTDSLLGQKPQAGAAVLMPDMQRFSVEPVQDRFLDYASERFADPAYAAASLRAFAAERDPKFQEKAAALSKSVQAYQQAVADSRTVREADVPAAERLKYLAMLDEEGKRTAVSAALKDVLDALAARSDGDAVWDAYFSQTRRDLQAQRASTAGTLAANDRGLESIRQAYWHGRVGLPLDLEGSFQKLEKLWQAKEAERQTLFKEYLGSQDTPLQFQLQNLELDKYMKASEAFDAELLALARDPRVSGGKDAAGDKDLVRMLDSLYDYRAASQRQRDKFAYGRAALTIDVLSELAQTRLDGLKYADAAPEQVQDAARRVDQFRELKERWTSDPSALDAVYAEMSVDAAGARVWDARGWLTGKDYADLKKAGRVITTDGGREWILPDAVGLEKAAGAGAAALGRLGALELVRGIDVRRAAAEERAQLRQDNARELQLKPVLDNAPFALVGDSDVQPLSDEQRRDLRSQGRLYYFRTQADEQGRHDAIHPWVAETYNPRGYDVLVFMGDPAVKAQRAALESAQNAIQGYLKKPAAAGIDELRTAQQALAALQPLADQANGLAAALAAAADNTRAAALRGVLESERQAAARLKDADSIGSDRFPTRESIAAAGLSQEFRTLRVGVKGYQALQEDAAKDALRWRRSGYVSLKLTSYAFGADKDGTLTNTEGKPDVYLTKDELNKARTEIQDAPSLIVKQTKELHSAAEDLADAEKDLYGDLPELKDLAAAESKVADLKLQLALDKNGNNAAVLKSDKGVQAFLSDRGSAYGLELDASGALLYKNPDPDNNTPKQTLDNDTTARILSLIAKDPAHGDAVMADALQGYLKGKLVAADDKEVGKMFEAGADGKDALSQAGRDRLLTFLLGKDLADAVAARNALLKTLDGAKLGGKLGELGKADKKRGMYGETAEQLKEQSRRTSFSKSAEKPATMTLEEALAALQTDMDFIRGELKGSVNTHDIPYRLKERKLAEDQEAVAFKRQALDLLHDKGREKAETQIDNMVTDAGNDDKKAQDAAREAADAVADAAKRIDAARAEVERLTRVKTEGAGKRFFLSDDMAWQLNANNELVGIHAPALSGPPLDLEFGSRDGARTVSGRIEAVELDKDSNLVKIYDSRSQMEKASQGWELHDIEGHPEATAGGEPGSRESKTYDIQFRAWEYVDPKSRDQIYLNRDYLVKKLDSAQGGLSYAKYYAFVNFPSLILQIPRGIITAPEEVIFGTDPNQNDYLGRVYMYKSEGGTTVRHGVAMSAVHLLDILDLIPDPAERFMDPSQFPQMVQLSGPIMPGQDLSDKSPRTEDYDVHLGVGNMTRRVGYDSEQVESDRNSAPLDFEGGSQTTLVDDRNGRAGSYKESKVLTDVSPDALVAAAAKAGTGAVIDRSGRRADAEATPEHIEVTTVHETFQTWLGQRGYEKQAADFDGEARYAVRHFEDVAAAAPALEKDAAEAAAALQEAETERQKAREGVALLNEELRRWDKIIGEHDAREAAIKDLTDRIQLAKRDLLFEEAYLKALEDALRHGGQPPVVTPAPGHKDASGAAWKALIEIAGFGIIAFTVWHFWSRRHQQKKPGDSWLARLRSWLRLSK